MLLLARRPRGLVIEQRLFQPAFDADRAAVDALQLAALLQFLEIAPRRGGGNAQLPADLLQADHAPRADQFPQTGQPLRRQRLFWGVVLHD